MNHGRAAGVPGAYQILRAFGASPGVRPSAETGVWQGVSDENHNRREAMSPKKPWITQIRPNEKRQRVQSDKNGQQEQQDQQQERESGTGSTE
jgi:hypothetical protein